MANFLVTRDGKNYLVQNVSSQSEANNIADQRHLIATSESRVEAATRPRALTTDADTAWQRASQDQREYEQQPWWKRFSESISKPIREAGYGIQEFAGFPLSRAQQQRLDTAENRVSGGVGMAGELMGDLAMFATPSKLLTGAGQIAANVPRLGRTLTTAGQYLRNPGFKTDLAQATVIEGLKAPTNEQDREDRVFNSLLGGALFKGLGTAGSRVTQGLPTSPSATNLIDEFGLENLTPGQRTPGLISSAENTLAESGVVGKPITELREKGLDEMSDALLNRLQRELGIEEIVGGRKLTATQRTEGWDVIKQEIGDQYNRIWNKDYEVDAAIFANYRAKIVRLQQIARTDADAGQLKRITALLGDVDSQMLRATEGGTTNIVPGRTIKSIKQSIQNEIDALYDGKVGFTDNFMDGLKDVRDSVQDILPQSARDELTPLNAINREFRILRSAGDKTLTRRIESHNLTPTVLRETSTTSSRDRIIDEAQDIQDVFGGSGGAGTEGPLAGRLMTNIMSSPVALGRPFGLTSPTARDLFTGQSPIQRQGQRLSDILRLNERFIPTTSTRVGASIGTQENLSE
jgi:hypothetical protein